MRLCAPTRSTTTWGIRAYGESRRHIRTISAQSSGRIISSAGMPDHAAIAVSTKPGQSAIARTPASSSSRFCDRVSAITAAFVAPYTVRPGVGAVPAIDARLMIQPRLSLHGNGLAGDEQEAAQVHAELEVDVLRLQRLDRPGDADAGRVDEDVQPAVALAMLRDGAHAVLFAAHVGGDRQRSELGRRRLDLLLSSRGDRQSVALRGEHPRDRETDPGRAAGDERAGHPPTLKEFAAGPRKTLQYDVPLPDAAALRGRRCREMSHLTLPS